MKIPLKILLFLAAICAGCSAAPVSQNRTTTKPVPSWEPPAGGTLVSSFRQDIREDKLNNSEFKVEVYSTDSSKKGYYRVALASGYAKEVMIVDFPKWTDGIVVQPVIQKTKNDYEVQLGFHAGDSSFHPYYEIKMRDNALKVDKVRKYLLQ